MPVLQTHESDPRFLREAPKDPRAKAAYEAKQRATTILSCAFANCRTTLDLSHVQLVRRQAYAEAHGWQVHERAERVRATLKTPSGPMMYCCRTCIEKEAHTLETKPSRALESYSRLVDRVTVKDGTTRDGRNVRAIVCDRWACTTELAADPTLDDQAICRQAQAAGFVQAPHGTCCGMGCARLLKTDIACGRQKSVILTAGFVAAQPKPATRPAVAPLPMFPIAVPGVQTPGRPRTDAEWTALRETERAARERRTTLAQPPGDERDEAEAGVTVCADAIEPAPAAPAPTPARRVPPPMPQYAPAPRQAPARPR